MSSALQEEKEFIGTAGIFIGTASTFIGSAAVLVSLLAQLVSKMQGPSLALLLSKIREPILTQLLPTQVVPFPAGGGNCRDTDPCT